MNGTLLVVASAILLSVGRTAAAHRLDEYLQATLISIEEDRVQAQMRLTPGVAVASIVLATIDTNSDGAIAASEQRAYAQRVLHDLTVTADGEFLPLELLSVVFPVAGEMKEGLGEIQISFSAKLPHGGPRRSLVFKNYHQPNIGTYLVNCLVPRDRNIQVVAQHRNEQQSVYELDYTHADNGIVATSHR